MAQPLACAKRWSGFLLRALFRGLAERIVFVVSRVRSVGSVTPALIVHASATKDPSRRHVFSAQVLPWG